MLEITEADIPPMRDLSAFRAKTKRGKPRSNKSIAVLQNRAEDAAALAKAARRAADAERRRVAAELAENRARIVAEQQQAEIIARFEKARADVERAKVTLHRALERLGRAEADKTEYRVNIGPTVSVGNVIATVACYYNVETVDMISSRRTANVVRARQIAMFVAKCLSLKSLPEIGRRFGGRDHTTILHAVRKIAAIVETNDVFAAEIEEIKRLILAPAVDDNQLALEFMATK